MHAAAKSLNSMDGILFYDGKWLPCKHLSWLPEFLHRTGGKEGHLQHNTSAVLLVTLKSGKLHCIGPISLSWLSLHPEGLIPT